MTTRQQKLETIETRLRRWMTRGVRAQNAINKLLRQQARLRKEPAAKPERPRASVALAELGSPTMATAIKEAAEDAGIELTRPAFLDRTDPLIAEKMTAARKKAEAAERSKMPLTGRDAMKAIRAKKTG